MHTLLQMPSGWVGLSILRLAVSCALPFNCHWPEMKSMIIPQVGRAGASIPNNASSRQLSEHAAAAAADAAAASGEGGCAPSSVALRALNTQVAGLSTRACPPLLFPHPILPLAASICFSKTRAKEWADYSCKVRCAYNALATWPVCDVPQCLEQDRCLYGEASRRCVTCR